MTTRAAQRGLKRTRSPLVEDSQPCAAVSDTVLDPLTVPAEDEHRFGTALCTLDIQGFRSFGPLGPDVGHIDWMSPVTLILGPNGTGKTSIIECLKFAATGEVPPNSNRGSAFIHDPKISGTALVRGQVTMKFFGADNKEYILTRTAEGKVAKNARGATDVKFKTLEATLNCKDDYGQKRMMAQTVEQAGQQMQSILGVAKPILNSVIFCHQEESDWPLDNASKLKEKFDEIFSATKYIKALEACRNMKKDDKAELTAAEERKDEKRIHLKDADSRSVQLTVSKSDMQELSVVIGNLTKERADLEIHHDKLQLRLEDATKTEALLEKSSAELKSVKVRVDDLSQRLGEEYVGSTDELRLEMQSSQSVTGDKKRQLETHNKRSSETEKKLADLRKKFSGIRESLGSLTAQSDQHNKLITERDTLVKDLAKQFGMKMYMKITGALLPQELDGFLKDFGVILNQLEERHAKHKTESDDEMERLTQNVASKRQELDNLVDNLKRLKKEIREKGTRSSEITDELSDMQTQFKKLADLEVKITTQEATVKSSTNSVDVTELKRQVSEYSERRKVLAEEIKVLKTAINQKEGQQGLHTQIQVLDKQKVEKRDLVDKLRNKLSPFLDHLGTNIRNEDIKSTLDKKLKESSDTLDEERKSISLLETDVALKDQERLTTKKELDVAETLIKATEEEKERLCGSRAGDITEAMKVVDDEIGKLQTELAEWQGKAHVYKGFRDKIKKAGGAACCPTCHRNFGDENEAEELMQELNKTLLEVPTQVKSRQGKISERNKNRDSVVAFVPQMRKLDGLRKSEAELKGKLKKIGDEYNTLTKEKATKEGLLEVANTLHQVCVESQGDALKLEGSLVDLKKIEKQLGLLASQLDKSGDTRALEKVKSEKESKEGEIESIDAGMEQNRDNISEYERKLNKQKDELNSLREQKLKITEKLQQRLKLEQQLQDLKSEMDKAKAEEVSLSQKEGPLKMACESLLAHKQMTMARLNEEREEIEHTRGIAKTGQKDVQSFAGKIKEYERKGVHEDLRAAKDELGTLTQDIKLKEQEFSELRESIRRIEKDLGNVANRDQILQDNLALRELREELKTLNQKHEEHRVVLEKADPGGIRRDVKQLAVKKAACDRQLFGAQGRESELQRVIVAREKELEADHLKNAKKYYTAAALQCEILDIAMRDLEKFYKALDLAVMKFHSNKMEEINKVLRDLWQNTYQGNDIDYIEIRSDADDSGIEGDKARRTYSYRVVMVCGDTCLDMRGRCSAGQRVLACLVIRLALAEAFAMNCGILALDEPTTNLDRENIEHLAKSLSRLIRSRQYEQQRHRFQLIIITHDADFLNILNTASTGPLVDFYYKIYKDNSGKSRLKKLAYGTHI